jgi:aconitate hydratase
VAGENYGQGSSREQTALAPRHLGIRGVIAKGFARIHLANLVNFGLLPFVFVRTGDYDCFAQDDTLSVDTEELAIVKAGGRLNWIRMEEPAIALSRAVLMGKE